MSNNALPAKRTATWIIPQIGISCLTLAVVACAPISSTPQAGDPGPDPTEDVIDTAGIDTLGGNIVEDEMPPGEEPTVDDTPAPEDEPVPDGPSEVEEAPEMNTDPVVDDEPLNNDDPVVPDHGDADNDAPVPPSSAQSWRAIASASEIFPFAWATYSFTESGALEQVEYEFSTAPVTNGAFEGVNNIHPFGSDTEVFRRMTIDEGSDFTAVERFYSQYSRADLAFLPDGEVTLSSDLTIRTESYFSSPSQGLEDTLFGKTTQRLVTITTGRLSEDGTTIVWVSVSGESTYTTELIGFPPQESSGPYSIVYAEGDTEPWVLVGSE